MKDPQPQFIPDIPATLASVNAAYRELTSGDALAAGAIPLKATVIRATDKACAVVLTMPGRRLSAAVRIPRPKTVEEHSGWGIGACCPFSTARRLHVSIWADPPPESLVSVPSGKPGSVVVMLGAELARVLLSLKILGKIDRNSDFVN